MSDPNRPLDHSTDPNRTNPASRGVMRTSWVIGGAIGAVLVIALILWATSVGEQTADTGQPASTAQTTGANPPANPPNPSQNPSTPPARAQ